MTNDIDVGLTTITGLGDSIVLGAFALTLAFYLLLIGYRREALAMVLAFLLPATIIGFLKITFYICNTNLWGVVSPSGHSAISIGVLGVSSLILAKISVGLWRAIIPFTLIILAITIAISRTILGMHTDGDVVVGSLIGLLVVILIAKVILSYRVRIRQNQDDDIKKKAHPLIVIVLILFVVSLSYGIKLPSEKVMSSIAKELRQMVTICN
jgi:membrane-associated phospholipid phosphatase